MLLLLSFLAEILILAGAECYRYSGRHHQQQEQAICRSTHPPPPPPPNGILRTATSTKYSGRKRHIAKEPERIRVVEALRAELSLPQFTEAEPSLPTDLAIADSDGGALHQMQAYREAHGLFCSSYI